MRYGKKLHFLLNPAQKTVFPEKASVPNGQYERHFPKKQKSSPRIREELLWEYMEGVCQNTVIS